MNENNLNELTPVNGAPSEAQRRAEKINAIKSAMRSENKISEPVGGLAPDTEYASPKLQQTEAEEWENEIAERIAQRVRQMKDKKSGLNRSTDSLIKEIDRILAQQDSEAAEENAIPDEEIQENSQTADYTQYEEENNFQDAPEESDSAQEEAEEYAEEPEAAAFVQEDERPVKKSKKKKRQKKTVGQKIRGIFPQKKDSIGEKIRKIVFLVSIAAIIVCGYIVVDYYLGNYVTETRYNDMMDMYSAYKTPPAPVENDEDEYDGPVYEMLPGARKLLDINEEIVGVINIPGTKVNYPIVQSEDQNKYLNRDVMGNEAKAGAIFLDYRCRFDKVVDGRLTEPNTDNLIVYGHNMADEMMFGSLRRYKEYDYYYGEHPIIELNSNYQTYTYKIFAFFILDANDETETAFDCWNNINFAGEEDFYNFVNEAKRRTLRLNDVDVEYGDKLLTLSTCNSIFGTGGRGRLIVLARQVRDGEDPYEGTQNSTANPNIKWPSLYYKYKDAKYDPDAEFIPYGPSAEEESSSEE